MDYILQRLIDNREINLKKLEYIAKGNYGKGLEGWFITKEDVNGHLPDKLIDEAIGLHKVVDQLLLDSQKDAFASHPNVIELNERYGVTFVAYDDKLGFSDNCRNGFEPHQNGEQRLYLFFETEDEIAKDAIKRYESSPLYKETFLKLIELYDLAISLLT